MKIPILIYYLLLVFVCGKVRAYADVPNENFLQNNCYLWMLCQKDNILKLSRKEAEEKDGTEVAQKEIDDVQWQILARQLCNSVENDSGDQEENAKAICPLLCDLCIDSYPDNCPIDINEMCDCKAGENESSENCSESSKYSDPDSTIKECKAKDATVTEHTHKQTKRSTISEIFTDLSGYQINWLDTEDGWNINKRIGIVKTHYNNLKQPHEVPQFTKTGFKKMKIPDDFYQYLKKHFKTEDLIPEPCFDDEALLNCHRIKDPNDPNILEMKNNTKIPKHPITNEVKSHVTSIMKPIFEDWLNSEEDQYQPTPKPIIVSEEGATVYGTRRYLRGSAIHLHTDRVSSQVISTNLNVDQEWLDKTFLIHPQVGVILQMDQDIDEEWPLIMIDLTGQKQEIFLKAGEMVLMENAKVPHGRQIPLNGNYYDNLFVHFH